MFVKLIDYEQEFSRGSTRFHRRIVNLEITITISQNFEVSLKIFSRICLFCTEDSGQALDGLKVEDTQGGGVQDGKLNVARREQYYATVRKLPPSPVHLECIPGQSTVHNITVLTTQMNFGRLNFQATCFIQLLEQSSSYISVQRMWRGKLKHILLFSINRTNSVQKCIVKITFYFLSHWKYCLVEYRVLKCEKHTFHLCG